jgi:thioredoxin 1
MTFTRRKTLLALAFTAFTSTSAMAITTKAFDAADLVAAQKAGKTVMLDVTAPWCPTCKAQKSVIDTLAKNPAYANMTIYEIDFDTRKDVLRLFKVQQQSTLIVFKGETETGRSVGITDAKAIETLIKAGF